MLLLPKWTLASDRPMFNDTESATGIEMVAKLYGAMQDLITEYNNFAEKINENAEEFEKGMSNDYEKFGIGLRQEFQDFIDIINLKVKQMDMRIKETRTEIIKGEIDADYERVILPITGVEIAEKINEGKIVVIEVLYDGGEMRFNYVGRESGPYLFYSLEPINNYGSYSFNRYVLEVENANYKEFDYYMVI